MFALNSSVLAAVVRWFDCFSNLELIDLAFDSNPIISNLRHEFAFSIQWVFLVAAYIYSDLCWEVG